MRTTAIINYLAGLIIISAIPASTPAAEQEQKSPGPREVLLAFDKEIGPGQTDKALAYYHTASTRERALAQCLATMDSSLASLHAAARAKFDRDIADAMVRISGAKTATDINEAKISIKGDTAEILFSGDSDPIIMTRVAGAWKISVKGIIRQFDADLRDFRKALTDLAAIVDKTTKDIESGQHKSPEIPSKILLDATKKAFAPEE